MANSSDYYYEKGLNFLDEENYDEALMYFDKAIDMEPFNVEYLNSKANCLYKLNQVDEAIEYFDKILEINPKNKTIKPKKAEILAIKANELIEDNEILDSMKLWDEIVTLDPNNAEYLNNKSQVLFKHAMIKESELGLSDKCSETLIRPRIDKAYHDELSILIKSNDLETASNIIDEAIDINYNLAPLLFRKGDLYFKLGKYDKAFEYFDKALELDPENEDKINKVKVEVYVAKGKSFESKTKYSEANECYDIAIAIEDKNPNLWIIKGQCLYYLSEYEKSIECYKKAYDIRKEPILFVSILKPLIKLKRYEEALDYLDEAKQLGYLNERAYWDYKLGFLMCLNKFDDAKDLAEDNLDLLILEKNYINEIEYLDNAIDCIDDALKLDKNNESFLNNKKEYLYQKAKRLTKFNPNFALDIVDELIELDSNNALYWDLKGFILLRTTTEYSKVRECYNNALKLMEND